MPAIYFLRSNRVTHELRGRKGRRSLSHLTQFNSEITHSSNPRSPMPGSFLILTEACVVLTLAGAIAERYDLQFATDDLTRVASIPGSPEQGQ